MTSQKDVPMDPQALGTWKDNYDAVLRRVSLANAELKAAMSEKRQLERDRVRYLRST